MRTFPSRASSTLASALLQEKLSADTQKGARQGNGVLENFKLLLRLSTGYTFEAYRIHYTPCCPREHHTRTSGQDRQLGTTRVAKAQLLDGIQSVVCMTVCASPRHCGCSVGISYEQKLEAYLLCGRRSYPTTTMTALADIGPTPSLFELGRNAHGPVQSIES